MHSLLGSLLANNVLITALISMFSAQVIKVVYYFILEKGFKWYHVFEAGGMPSSHSALVCSLALSVGLFEGLDSSLFAAVVVFSSIVMYDAIQVRSEEVGHTLVEVSAGALLGFLVSIASYLYF